MRVKMLIGRVGEKIAYNRGSEHEIPDERAARWIASGFAELAIEPAPEEMAVLAPVPERAVDTPVREVAVKGRRRK